MLLDYWDTGHSRPFDVYEALTPESEEDQDLFLVDAPQVVAAQIEQEQEQPPVDDSGGWRVNEEISDLELAYLLDTTEDELTAADAAIGGGDVIGVRDDREIPNANIRACLQAIQHLKEEDPTYNLHDAKAGFRVVYGLYPDKFGSSIAAASNEITDVLDKRSNYKRQRHYTHSTQTTVVAQMVDKANTIIWLWLNHICNGAPYREVDIGAVLYHLEVIEEDFDAVEKDIRHQAEWASASALEYTVIS